jgi:hypothetical protein
MKPISIGKLRRLQQIFSLRGTFTRTTARQRISRLTSLCHALAKPYTNFYTADAPFDWYKFYGA